jgi:hypothetical protein
MISFQGVNIPHAVVDLTWGLSDDIEHKSIITGKRKFVTKGDHADVTVTVYLWKCTAGEQATVKGMKRQEGTLVTVVGSGNFRCVQIQFGLLKNKSTKQIAIMSFKSIDYVD